MMSVHCITLHHNNPTRKQVHVGCNLRIAGGGGFSRHGTHRSTTLGSSVTDLSQSLNWSQYQSTTDNKLRNQALVVIEIFNFVSNCISLLLRKHQWKVIIVALSEYCLTMHPSENSTFFSKLHTERSILTFDSQEQLLVMISVSCLAWFSTFNGKIIFEFSSIWRLLILIHVINNRDTRTKTTLLPIK